MRSIKINNKTKERIERAQADLYIKHNQKVSQSEILERIIETTITDPEFMESLFPSTPSTPSPPKKQITIKIIARKKPDIRLFPDEWTD